MVETTILTKTKSYLVEHGVNLVSLTSSTKQRSETVIIAKNFPCGTTQDELLHLFGGTEIIKHILLPPAGTIAFLEFFDAGEARLAFKRLAYRRFKDVPLYLEKAPHGIFVVEPAQKLGGVQAKTASTDLLAAEDDEPGSTLYVKNLDFSTTQGGLTAAFQHFPGFRIASLKTKTNAKGDRLSMGFGFISFASKMSAQGAMNAGVVLDGRKLELKFARQGSEVEIQAGKGSRGAGRKKIVVKNLGFNVNKRDLRELFGTYGHIQSLRLPKKFDNSTRGFAFIEFTTASDAQNAMQALEHTHLLGRHLVLQWAEEEDGTGVEKVRGKIREGVEAGVVGEMMGFNQGAGGRVGDALGEEEM
jgi:multiple RNA-binding domain-containing protein 1